MRISLKYIILAAFLFTLVPALTLLSYIDYTKTKTGLEKNFAFMIDQTVENVTESYDFVEISYKIIADNLESEMKNAFIPYVAAYKEAKVKVAEIDLEKLSSELLEKVRPGIPL